MQKLHCRETSDRVNECQIRVQKLTLMPGPQNRDSKPDVDSFECCGAVASDQICRHHQTLVLLLDCSYGLSHVVDLGPRRTNHLVAPRDCNSGSREV
jgi:hypothetical protein